MGDCKVKVTTPSSGKILRHARLIPVPGGVAFEFSYDRDLLTVFKSRVPHEARRWDPESKRWLVAPQYARLCAELAAAYLGVQIEVPATSAPAQRETRLVMLEYLGACKDRGNGESTAFGWANGGWTIVFPEAVLRQWFSAEPDRPGEQPTLYAVLGVRPSATIDEIRSAYRRLARTWHPDVCKEPDAAEQFKTIQRAYEVLSNEQQRRKYDAGRALEATLGRIPQWQQQVESAYYRYRAPFRCGYVLVEGHETLGRFVVEKILGWEDITDSQGRTMVTSWPRGADSFIVEWV